MKRKVIALFSAFCLCLMLLPVCAIPVGAANGTCGSNLVWSYASGALTVSGTGNMTNFSSSSPAPWDGYSTDIYTVTIAEGVTGIGDWAFFYCTALTVVTIPDSVTRIGNFAFYNCTALISAVIGNGVTAIGEYAFENCAKLSELAVGGKVKSIGKNAFEKCGSLTAVVLPDSLTGIGAYAFARCALLTEITIPDGVSVIENNTFERCAALKTVRPGTGITAVGNYAFNKCESLTAITLPEGVTSIGSNAFAGCTLLAAVSVPDSVTRIAINAFSETAWLGARPNGVVYAGKTVYTVKGTCPAEVTVADGTVAIADNAFYQCATLKRISLPRSIAHIGNMAFYRCTALTEAVYRGSRGQWTSVTVDPFNEWMTDHLVFASSAPLPPVIASVNGATVTLQAVEGCEYRCDGGAWQISPAFTEVSAGVDHVFMMRYAATDTTEASEMSKTFLGSVSYGDPDGNGKSDADDLTVLAKYVAKITVLTAASYYAADVDNDGDVDADDLTKYAKYIAKIIPDLD